MRVGRAASAALSAVPLALESYGRRRLGQHASAIAYRTLVAIVPLTIVLVALFGLVLRDEELQARVIDWVVDVLPFDDAARAEVESAIVAIASPASLLGFLGLLAFLWTATGLMTSVRLGLEEALDVPRGRPVVHGKLVDATLVGATALLVVLVVLLGSVASLLQVALDRLGSWLGVPVGGLTLTIVGHGVRVVLVFAVATALLRYVPARRLPIGHALAGAAAVSIMLLAISVGSQLVLDRTSELSAVYGSLTTVLAFLFAVYLSAAALLVGATFAWALGQPPAPPGPPLARQLRAAIVGLVRRPADR